MKCSVLKDLLSDYVRGQTSEETAAEINNHLKECEECRRILENMSVSELSQNNNRRYISGKNRENKKRVIKFSACAAVILFIGFILFSRKYELVLPFDKNRMYVEHFEAAVVTNQRGEPRWVDVERLYNNWVYIDPQEEIQIPENYDTLELVRLASRGINHIFMSHTARTIHRDGESVRVIYYCYSKTLWYSLFYDADLSEYSESTNGWGTFIYGDDYQTENYIPQMREIYYLPMKGLSRLESLSDKEFDAMREKATLVWRGVI